tara:strand:+ start:29283 stop:30683 length:1401 start_codon:yes stop_codon:yes gene_type:complete
MTLKPKTLAVRLTLWYSLISTGLFLASLSILYFLVAAALLNAVDEDLVEDIDEFNIQFQSTSTTDFWLELSREAEADGAQNILFRLYSDQGTLLRETDTEFWRAYQPISNFHTELLENSKPQIESVHLEQQEIAARTVYGVLERDDGNYILQISETLEERADVLEVFLIAALICVPLLMLLSIVAGWFMARRALGGVHQVTNTAIHISNGALGERVPAADHGAEIDRLAVTFNDMLDKIQLLIRGIREMNDNIAHDLKSPLARIRGIAETTLTGEQNSDNYQQLAGSTIEECDRLLHLINTMLDLAETEAGIAPSMENLQLDKLLNDACELYQPLCHENGISLSSNAQDNISILGNKQFLQRLLSNLLDNAIKYTPKGGSITLESEVSGKDVLIKISDTGVGISQEDLPNIFQRFYRCDTSRSKPGTGLGLCLALAIAKAHWGNISVSSKIAEGTEFVVSLPISIS